MKTILTLLFLFAATVVFGQSPDIESQKILGGFNYDNASCIQQTSDGGFIIAGSSISTDGDITGNNGDYDFWIVKLTSTNTIQWKKSLGGSAYEYATSIQQTADGGYIVAGYTWSNDGSVTGNHGGFDVWIIKLSSSGNILLNKCLGGTGQDFATSVQQTPDGGFILAGYTDSNNGDVSGNKGGYDYWIVKLDSTGLIQWQKCLGGTAMDYATSIKKTSDGGYIVAGYSDSNDGDVSGNHGGDDYWIVKLNSTGLILWQKSYGGSGNDMANAVQTVAAGGFIVAGTYQKADGDITGTRTNDYWILKLSNTGVILWQKSLGGNGDDVANAVQTTSDGGFIVAGSSSSSNGDISSNKGIDDYWVLKLKSNGALLWQKNMGGSNTDIARSVQQTADGGYVVAGSTVSGNGDVAGFHGTASFINYDDYWIVKLYKEPDVIISAEPGTLICNGTPVVITTTLNSSVVSPAYQWKKNGVNVGTNSDTYTDNLLTTADSVICVVTSLGNTLNSNTLKFTVIAKITPGISVAANPGTSFCLGTTVIFTATPINGGETPVYQWKKNGINKGTNNAIYKDSLLNNNDSVWCVLTSSESCVTSATANSNKIKASVISKTPSITISADKTSTCPQEIVTFTAAIVNGGTTPVYSWKKNGNTVGTNNSVFSSALNNNDSVWCVLTSNDICLTANGVKSNTIKITVTANVVVSVSITSSVPGPICSGTSVTFTATPVNGGTSPIYQWKKNGINVGTNSPTYTTATLINDDTIYCTLTSNVCTTVSTKTSNKIRFTVNPLVTPTISVSTNTGSSICVGTKVTFSTTITNGGTSPVYQWRKNGVIVGTNFRTYTDSTLNNGDAVFCKLTSNVSCASVTGAISSNTITMTVASVSTPTISIVSNPPSPICQGVSPTLTATITNGGSSPVYKWKKNSVTVGTNSPTFTPASVINNDTIWCELTSSSGCASPSTVKSNKIRFTVNPTVTASVTISANTGTTICNGTKVTFTATAVNGGTPPVYQWKKNAINVGTNSKTYSDTTLNTNDTVYCVITSTASCVTNSQATSNKIKFTVNPVVKPSITITADNSTTICTGTTVNFVATPVNGGASPSYQWKKNGVNVGSNSPTFSISTLQNNDTIYCYLTSSAACPVPAGANSNKIRFTVITVPATPSVISGPASVTANLNNIFYSVTNVSGVTNTWTVPASVTILSGQGTEKIKVKWGTSSGTITVNASNTCGLAANTRSLNVTVVGSFTRVNTKESGAIKNQWSIYPNPTKGIANITFASSTDQKYVLEISDAVGKVLSAQSGYAYKGENMMRIDLSKYAAGMYYIRYSDKEHGLLMSRIIKSD